MKIFEEKKRLDSWFNARSRGLRLLYKCGRITIEELKSKHRKLTIKYDCMFRTIVDRQFGALY